MRVARLARGGVAAAAVVLLAAAPPRRPTAIAPRDTSPPHNLHVTNTRMVVEGDAAVARIRIFRDDFEKTLKQPVTDQASSKATVAAYVARTVLLTADGKALTGEVLDSGADQDADQPIWWVIVQWKAAKPIKTIGLRVHLLFDGFKDQQNIVQLAHNPGDERHGLYFQPGDLKEQVLRF